MTRLLLKVASASLVLFALVIGVIRAQPYDDHGLREFLAPPDGCPAPCFMGIRPGVTTAAEVEQRLLANRRVENLLYLPVEYNLSDNAMSVIWRWADGEQSFVDLENQRNSIIIVNNVVSFIIIQTNIRMGDVFLSLGNPRERFPYENERPCSASPRAIYPDSHIIAQTTLEFPSLRHFEQPNVEIWIHANPGQFDTRPPCLTNGRALLN